MLVRGVVACVCLLVVGGCAQEQKPRITYNPPVVESGPAIAGPKPTVTKPVHKREVENVPREWLPPSWVEKKWTAVIVHHSATDSGNASIFDEWHREEKNWNGVGYDFVIGNGTDSADGEVEVTYRWREQKTGAHCGGTPDNWANTDGIGICLVGNFENEEPTPRQIQSLVKLVRFLQRRYDISTDRIYGHKTTPGARVTDCPGRRFPMARFKSVLGE